MNSRLYDTKILGYLALIFITLAFIGLPTAQSVSLDVSLIDKSYEVSKTSTLNDNLIVYYNLSFTLYNAGSEESADYTVSFRDDLTTYRQNSTMPAGGTKSFYWNDHPIVGQDPITIDISFYPTDLSLRDQGNYVNDTLILYPPGTEDDESTPGFAFSLVVIGTLLIFGINRKKRG